MWFQEQNNGKFKYFERYVDPYTEKYKTVTITLKSNSNTAKKEASRILLEKIEERLKPKQNDKMTLQELIDEWWEQYQKGVKNSSILATSKVKKIVEKGLDMDSLIHNVDTKMLQKFFNSLDYSYAYTKKVRGALNQAYNYALDMEYVEVNPVVRTKIIRPVETLENVERVENNYLEKEEVELLLNMYYSTYQSVRMGYLAEFMYLTGMRFGEVIALTESNFLKETKMLEVHGTLDYSGSYATAVKTTTKTKASHRELFLSNRAIEILETVMDENKKYDDVNEARYIFIGKTGKPIRLNSFNQSLKEMNDKLGKKKIKKKISSHIFRHSHISLLSEMNLPIKAIMERVGHSDEKITLQIYTHVTKKQRTDITEKMNELGF
ncbi:tyrosine-type recombinase/integrase [Vagococcus fluvialis]|uniref:tyrosine-type recombinase/integrase n=1 Tax=Vagococcus fluvialis TaxID=2738 RepID=UPI002033E7AD|nr:site-specific integrase [Vagococcus fluvialis]MCM2138940.1 site-specific integrase [Vagococcus fluvialis]